MNLNTKEFGNVIEETMKKLEADVNSLKSQEQRLKVSISELQVMRNKLTADIANSEVKAKADKETAEKKSAELITLAQQKLDNAQQKESTINAKVSDLNDKIKEARDLIRQYENFVKTAEAKEKALDIRISKLNEIIALFKQV